MFCGLQISWAQKFKKVVVKVQVSNLTPDNRNLKLEHVDLIPRKSSQKSGRASGGLCENKSLKLEYAIITIFIHNASILATLNS